MIFRFIPIAIILFLGSCASNETSDSANVKQSEIYQNYDIFWVKGKGSATASFRFGGENGTTLRLTNPSAITLNGHPLELSKFLLGGAYYSIENMPFSDTNTFRFIDTEGKTFVNSMSFRDVEFVNAPKTVSKTEDLILELSRPIKAGENITLNAESDTSKSNEMVIDTSPNSSAYYDLKTQRLIIKPEFFKDFADVPATIWLEYFKQNKPLNQPTNLGGEIRFSFQSNLIIVERLDPKKDQKTVAK